MRKRKRSRQLFAFLVVQIRTGHRVIVKARNPASAMQKARRAKSTATKRLKDGRTIGVCRWPFYGTEPDGEFIGYSITPVRLTA